MLLPVRRAVDGTGVLQRLSRIEAEIRRLRKGHRLLLSYVRGLDEDLGELEDLFPAGESPRGEAGRQRQGALQQGQVQVECGECGRTVALLEGEVGDFTDAIRCPYCGAELMKAWKPAPSR